MLSASLGFEDRTTVVFPSVDVCRIHVASANALNNLACCAGDESISGTWGACNQLQWCPETDALRRRDFGSLGHARGEWSPSQALGLAVPGDSFHRFFPPPRHAGRALFGDISMLRCPWRPGGRRSG